MKEKDTKFTAIDKMRLEKLNAYYRYLYGTHEIHDRKEFAERIGVSYHTINTAFMGGRYLSDKLLARIAYAFPSLDHMDEGDDATQSQGVYSKEFVESLQRTNESLARANEALIEQLEMAQRSGYVAASLRFDKKRGVITDGSNG